MKAYIDIENSKTQNVDTICVDIIKYEYDSEVIFDISSLDKRELSLLYDAIDESKPYTDVEMFFIDDSNIPNFGPDYNYNVKDNKLILKYIPKKRKEHVEEKNYDWTLNYEEEFNRIAYKFLNTKYNYLLIYNDDGIKYEYLKDKPKDSIFMDLFYDNNFNMIALFKKKDKVNVNNLRGSLEYINSYCDEIIDERREI